MFLTGKVGDNCQVCSLSLLPQPNPLAQSCGAVLMWGSFYIRKDKLHANISSSGAVRVVLLWEKGVSIMCGAYMSQQESLLISNGRSLMYISAEHQPMTVVFQPVRFAPSTAPSNAGW